MNRYSMPVHPKSLEKDYKSHQLVKEIPRLTATLKSIKTQEQFEPLKKDINEILFELWFQINSYLGINLKDREKLYPLFKEIGRLYGVESYPYAYRGVRLSSWDGNAISQTYPDLQVGDVILNPKEPRVVDHLEGLAYGLRSWTHIDAGAFSWSSSKRDFPPRDKIVFQISNPEVVLDANNYLYGKSFSSVMPFDADEIILFIKNPKVISIKREDFNTYLVTIKDN
jgi:hypothetical protein